MNTNYKTPWKSKPINYAIYLLSRQSMSRFNQGKIYKFQGSGMGRSNCNLNEEEVAFPGWDTK